MLCPLFDEIGWQAEHFPISGQNVKFQFVIETKKMTSVSISLNLRGRAKALCPPTFSANASTARCYQHSAAGPWQVATLIAGSKWRCLLMAGDNDEMFMTRSLNVMPKTTEQRLIVRSDKSVAYVTNNKRLWCSTFHTIEANSYWQQS